MLEQRRAQAAAQCSPQPASLAQLLTELGNVNTNNIKIFYFG